MTGIYIKWHEKINVQKKYDVHQKEYRVQQNMVNASEKEEVEWKIRYFQMMWQLQGNKAGGRS